MFLEIPLGFSANLTMHADGGLNVTGMVNIYGVFNGGGGIFSGIGGAAVIAVVGSFNRAVAPDVVAVSQSSIIKGQIEQGVDASTLSGLMLSQSIALPITIMIMLTYAMQIAATR
jgi:hypothetical protein